MFFLYYVKVYLDVLFMTKAIEEEKERKINEGKPKKEQTRTFCSKVHVCVYVRMYIHIITKLKSVMKKLYL